MKHKGVIFDLDGTLLDTLEDIADAANRVLASRGFPTRPLEVHKASVGSGVRVLMERVLPADRNDVATIQECFVAFRKDYGEHWNVKTKPYSGVPELLTELQSRGMKMTVLSNKPADFTRKCVEGILSQWKFDAVLGGEDGLPSKPDPAGALEIVKRLKLPVDAFLYLGDTGVDMQTATRAGMYAVGALWGFRGREELLRDGAKALIEHPHDLLGLLE